MTKYLAIHWAQRLPRCAALGRRRSCGNGCDAFAVHSGLASGGQQHGSLWASCRVGCSASLPTSRSLSSFGALGFIAGVTFSGLLVLTEGRRRLDQLSLLRVAGWGAIGGVLLSALFVRDASLGWGEVLAISTTFALASAVSASGSLALARRAVGRELPDSRGDTAEAELTDYEKRKLLGGGN